MHKFVIITCCVLLGICIYYLQQQQQSSITLISSIIVPQIPQLEEQQIQVQEIQEESKSDTITNITLPIANKDEPTYLPALIDQIHRMERSMWHRYQMGDTELLPLKIYLEQLHSRIDNLEILEGFVENRTSYSIAKQRIILCMRSKEPESWSKLIDENIVMFALIHELGHVACPCIDHPPEFTDVFRGLLYQAIRYGIWKPVDYEKVPVRYCGKTVAAVPLTPLEMHEASIMPLTLIK